MSAQRSPSLFECNGVSRSGGGATPSTGAADGNSNGRCKHGCADGIARRASIANDSPLSASSDATPQASRGA